MIRPIDLIPSPVKLLLAISYDALALSLAFFIAYSIRLGVTEIPFNTPELMTAGITIFATIALFYSFGVYSTVVRHFSADNIVKVISLLTIATLGCYIFGFVFDAFVPRSVPIVFLALGSIFCAGARAAISLLVDNHLFEPREGVVIYGSGKMGRQLATALIAGNTYQPLAFIDTKTRYHNRNILGFKTYGPEVLPSLIKRHGNFKVLIALPEVEATRIKEVIGIFEPYALEILSIPNMQDLVSGKQKIDELREISVDELLGRDPVTPMPMLLSANITNKIVLVSGAGGSIGKELCRQIIKQNPSKLVLLDVCEAFLYEIDHELTNLLEETGQKIELVPRIGNVQNGMLMNRILKQQAVNTIYHAAAYKHVPMVENNVIAGITNNTLGTSELAQAAILNNVETFVLISTDKAVRPTNVMGATKRLAELVLQGLAQQKHSTRFVMVRFGNVLGSSGSVVPLFKRQIRSGGPITVTHPDIIRYFMTIPEAAQLVIQAGAMGKGGDVFVLDMGKPVKILDLAYKMAHLMGRTVIDKNNLNGDIEIQFSGLRPGEKLYEELLIEDNAEPTFHQRILTANESSIPYLEVNKILGRLIDAMTDEDVDKIKWLLMNAPLGYQPNDKDKPQTESNPLAEVC